MNGKIFLSYNHHDQSCALRIRQHLVATGWEVLMDVAHMNAGETIEHFIENCICQTDITILLVSANSLLSAWVAMEAIATHSDEKIRNRRLIPCYIDPAFFDRSFGSNALNTIDENLREIDGLMTEALQKGRGLEDLQSERSRYLKMKAHLPELLGRLRNMLCINLAGDAFEPGMQKIADDLQALRTSPQPATAIVQAVMMASPTEKIKTILNEGDMQRLESLQKRLAQLRQLQAKYEEELDFETDPKRQMRYEREITITKAGIEKVMAELNAND